MAADTQESERKRKKSGVSKTQAAAKASEQDIADTAGYETDATSSGKTRTKLKKKSKNRKGSGDAGYETDDGYISSTAGHPPLHKSKSKSRFFKLGNRSKTQIDDDENREVPPPVPMPPPPVFRLPIAERFATTLGNVNKGATAEPPLGPPPSLPIASSTNSPLSTSSSSFITTPKELDLTDGPSLLPDLGSKRNFVHFASTLQKDVAYSRDSGSSDNHMQSGSNSLFSKLNFTSFEPFSSSNNSSPVKTKVPAVTFPTTRPSSPPTTSKPVISYPITRSPSPPPSPPTIQIIPNPLPNNKESTKNVPKPLFLHRVPSDLGKGLNPQMNRSPLPEDWSPAGSPFVVLTPNPTPSPTIEPRRLGAQKSNSSDTVTKQPSRLQIPSSATPSRDHSPARSPVVPSTDYIVPSPRPGVNDTYFTPPVIHHSPYSDLPPVTPPPTSPLPDVPSANAPDNQDSGSYFASQQHRRPEPSHSNTNLTVNSTLQRGRESPFPSPSNSSTNLTINSTPQRGRESPFPSRPVLPSSHRTSHRPQPGTGYAGFESRVKVKRYRDLYGWGGQIEDDRGTSPIPDIYMQDTSSREPDSRRHRPRQSTKVGIKVEEPSDDEGYGGEDGFGDSDYYDEEEMNYVVNGMFSDRSVSDLGHYGGDQRETEAALSRSHSYEALRDRYQNPQTTIAVTRPRGRGGRSTSRPSSPNVQSKRGFDYVDDVDSSDDKSRYPDDEVTAGRATMYSTLGGDLSRRGSWESGSRVSFMDNEKSQQARERFLRRVDMFYDETGREKPSPAPRGIGRGAIPAVPPVPRLPKGVRQPPIGSSKVWI